MNNLKIFENNEFEIRTSTINNEPYFALNDICKILEIANPRNVKSRLNKDGVHTMDGVDTLGRKADVTMINESNLYKLAFQSRKPQAERFTDWVTSEVLPAIRKHGAYATDNVLDQVLDNPDFGIELLNALKDERKKRAVAELENKKKDQIIGELTPKADYTDKILQSTSVVTITSIAKDYGLSGSKMNKLLHELGIQYKQGNQWLIYAKYHDKGYTHSETVEFPRSNGTLDVNMITKWTQKGRLFLYNELKDNGYLPMIERV